MTKNRSARAKSCACGMSAPLRVALLFMTLSWAVCQASDQACSGHGHMEENECVCDNPHPSPGDKGWTGTYCDIEVYGAYGDGKEETAHCADNGCNKLIAGEMRCWSLNAPWNSHIQPWNYLSVQLNRTSDQGDPDLFGLFWENHHGERVNQERMNSNGFGYDFKETSSAIHPLVNYVVNKERDFGLDHEYKGVWLCVLAYGPFEAEFSLAASTTLCPSSFDDQGQLLMCSSPVNPNGAGIEEERRYDQCVEGTCVCKSKWQKPTPSVYEGLGFDDCSTEVEEVPNASYKFYPDEVLNYKQWSFFKFNITKHDYEVVFRVTSEPHSTGDVELYLKSGLPPGNRYGQFDSKSISSALSSEFDQAEIKLSKAHANGQWRLGTWFAGIRNSGNKGRYIVEVARFGCPANCNGRGVCNYDDHTCSCSDGFFKEDCSGFNQRLEFDRQVATTRAQDFEDAFFKLPSVTADEAGHVEMTVTVEAWQGASQITHSDQTETAMPILLLKASDNDDDFPSVQNYTMKQEILKANVSYSITIASSQAKANKWTALIYNPVEYIPIGYKLLVSKQAFCPNGCTNADQGACLEDGSCACKNGWLGLACSIPAGACIQGSYQLEMRYEDHGTCWHHCDCQDGRCGFNRECSYFTCVEGDEPNGSGESPSTNTAYKKLAGQDICVEEEEQTAFSSPAVEKKSLDAAPAAKSLDPASGDITPKSRMSYLVGMGALVMLLSGAAGSVGTIIFLRRRGQMQDGRTLRSKLYEGIDMGDISASEALTEGTEELLISTQA